MIKASELSEGLVKEKEKDKWIHLLEKRAEALSTIYKEDNDILNRLDSLLKEIDKVDSVSAEVEDIYTLVYSLYVNNYDDPCLMLPILTTLENYFIRVKNKVGLLVCYSIHAYEAHEYITRANSSLSVDISIYKKILDLRQYYKEYKNEQVRYYIFLSFFNLVVGTGGLKGISLRETYDYLKLMEDFYHSDDVQALDKDNEYIKDLVDDTRLTWLLISESYDELDDFLKNELFRRSKEFIVEDIENSPKEAFMAYYRCLYGNNSITLDELLDIYFNYIHNQVDEIIKKGVEEEDFVAILELIISVLKVLKLKENNKEEIYLKLRDEKIRLENELPSLRVTPYINSLFADYVAESIGFDTNKERAEQDLFDNLIKRQAATYIHSVMVKNMAIKIYEYMDKELLKNIPNPHEFISNSALLHDIGKSKITDIVNMQRRRLLDEEFYGIKMHPSLGASILLKNPLLKDYYDVVIGHHKWYNACGGYPMEFNNEESQYKIVIDLITIADCLDAATDKYGRNYKYAKTVSDVVLEFEKDKGIKYSPYFVDLIKNNPSLLDELTYLAETKRKELMYEAYSKYYVEKE